MIGNIFVCIVHLPHINCSACFQSEFFIKDIEGVRSASVIIEIFELDTIKEGEIGVKWCVDDWFSGLSLANFLSFL